MAAFTLGRIALWSVFARPFGFDFVGESESDEELVVLDEELDDEEGFLFLLLLLFMGGIGWECNDEIR